MEDKKNYNQTKSIFVYKTNKYIFEVKDVLNLTQDNEIGRIHDPKKSKIHFFGATLDNNGKQLEKLNHYLNPDDLLTLITCIKNGMFSQIYTTKYGSQYIEYKGTSNSKDYDGKPESRVLLIKYKPKINNELARLPWTITIQSGEGQLKGEGAILPVNLANPKKKIEIKMSNHDFLKMILKVERYILNWEQYAFRKVLDTQYKFSKNQ